MVDVVMAVDVSVTNGVSNGVVVGAVVVVVVDKVVASIANVVSIGVVEVSSDISEVVVKLSFVELVWFDVASSAVVTDVNSIDWVVVIVDVALNIKKLFKFNLKRIKY